MLFHKREMPTNNTHYHILLAISLNLLKVKKKSSRFHVLFNEFFSWFFV